MNLVIENELREEIEILEAKVAMLEQVAEWQDSRIEGLKSELEEALKLASV